MNTSSFMLSMLLLMAFTRCATHGPDDKLKRDVTYSTHNYKHPNKAAQARAWEQSPSVPVKPDDDRNVALDNYKRQPVGVGRQGGITVPHQPSATVADRHYKTQNWLQNEPKPEIAKKPAKAAPDYPTTGN